MDSLNLNKTTLEYFINMLISKIGWKLKLRPEEFKQRNLCSNFGGDLKHAQQGDQVFQGA